MTLFRSFFSRMAVIAAGLAVFASGCSTDLDPNADYKETMVIYSVLNPRETVHIAKVTKAFLNTNTNAYTIAANSPDSSYYDAGELKVVLQKLTITNSDTTVKPSDEYAMVRIDTTGKVPGTFSTQKQILYRTQPGKPGKLDDKAVYRVVAKNEKNGVTASGTTSMIQENANLSSSFCILKIPSLGGFTGNCLSETDSSAYEPQEKGLQVRFRPAANAAIYTAKTVFYYTETTNGVTEKKHVEWYDANNFMPDPKASPINVEVVQNSFYENLVKLIDTSNDNATTTRKARYVLINVTAGSESLSKNYLANNSYSVFSQTRPEYDNIINGTGLVGSRLTKTVKGVFDSTPKAREAGIKLITNYPQLKFK